MCVFTHFAAGALVGSFSPSPLLAPVLGLGSHIVLDVIPHYDFENMKIDIFIGIASIVVLLVADAYNLSILLGGFAAVLPDLENLFWRLGKITDSQKVFPGHTGIIAHGRPAGKINLFLQIFFSVAVLVFLIGKGV